MFDLTVTPVKFVALLVMFAYCSGWWGYLVAQRQTLTSRVSNGLHLWMAVLMVAMVPNALWRPLVQTVGMPVLLGTQVVSLVWFAVLATRTSLRQRRPAWQLISHTVMFVAMVWHLGAMALMMLGRGFPTPEAMAAMRGARDEFGGGMVVRQGMSPSGEGAVLIFAIGAPIMAWLLAAGIWELRRVVRPVPATDGLENDHCHVPQRPGLDRLAALGNACMLLGMFWMSTGLLTGMLPFLRILDF